MAYFKPWGVEEHESGYNILEDIRYPKNNEYQHVKSPFDGPKTFPTATKHQVLSKMETNLYKNYALKPTVKSLRRAILNHTNDSIDNGQLATGKARVAVTQYMKVMDMMRV